MKLWAFGLLFCLSAVLLVGCSSTPKNESEERVSTLPWNAPAKWENTPGGMGGGANY